MAIAHFYDVNNTVGDGSKTADPNDIITPVHRVYKIIQPSANRYNTYTDGDKNNHVVLITTISLICMIDSSMIDM